MTNSISKYAKEEYCYLTTTGRKSGKLHEIEIWFGVNEGKIYLMSGGGGKSDWVKNLLKDPNAAIRIADQTFIGVASMVKDEKEELTIRHLLTGKYQNWKEDQEMSEWGKTAWVIGIALEQSS